jgi:hypothetical protein
MYFNIPWQQMLPGDPEASSSSTEPSNITSSPLLLVDGDGLLSSYALTGQNSTIAHFKAHFITWYVAFLS